MLTVLRGLPHCFATDTEEDGNWVFCLLFQRYEELSEKWDAAKRGVRQEDHELLREKVALQQELIRRQDEYADQKRQHHADQENKVGGVAVKDQPIK